MDIQDNGITRVLGIDFGLRRIGLALGDTDSRLASPFECLIGLADADAAAAIAHIVHEEQIGLIVCGVPLNEDESIGPQAKRTLEFIAVVQNVTDVEVRHFNEFLTTFEAQRLLAGSFTSGQKKRRLDAIAASRILQGYFDLLGR